jgi:hypothetical protein
VLGLTYAEVNWWLSMCEPCRFHLAYRFYL